MALGAEQKHSSMLFYVALPLNAEPDWAANLGRLIDS